MRARGCVGVWLRLGIGRSGLVVATLGLIVGRGELAVVLAKLRLKISSLRLILAW